MAECSICDSLIKVKYFGKNASGFDTYILDEPVDWMAKFKQHLKDAHPEQLGLKRKEVVEDD